MGRLFSSLLITTLLMGCAASHKSTQGGEGSQDPGDARAEFAEALFAVDNASSEPARAEALVRAWRARHGLIDDSALRELLKGIERAPAELALEHRLERNIARAGKGGDAASIVRALEAEPELNEDATGWSAARTALLQASLLPPEGEQQALAALKRVGRLKLQGPIGQIQRAQALLMVGSLEHRAARYKEAIAAFLKVSSSSGLWREARLGMAWSQLRIAQPERALASLSLLPGGLTGDPERALVAAMAAGALAKVEAARAVIDEARARASQWLDVEIDLDALRQSTLAPGDPVLLREPDEGLFIRLCAHPALRLLAAELGAASELAQKRPAEAAFTSYKRTLEHLWAKRVHALIKAERERVKRALEGLDALEPQLR